MSLSVLLCARLLLATKCGNQLRSLASTSHGEIKYVDVWHGPWFILLKCTVDHTSDPGKSTVDVLISLASGWSFSFSCVTSVMDLRKSTNISFCPSKCSTNIGVSLQRNPLFLWTMKISEAVKWPPHSDWKIRSWPGWWQILASQHRQDLHLLSFTSCGGSIRSQLVIKTLNLSLVMPLCEKKLPFLLRFVSRAWRQSLQVYMYCYAAINFLCHQIIQKFLENKKNCQNTDVFFFKDRVIDVCDYLVTKSIWGSGVCFLAV